MHMSENYKFFDIIFPMLSIVLVRSYTANDRRFIERGDYTRFMLPTIDWCEWEIGAKWPRLDVDMDVSNDI